MRDTLLILESQHSGCQYQSVANGVFVGFSKHNANGTLTSGPVRTRHGLSSPALDERGAPSPRVANDCGFGNLGRFAADYKARFNQLPSQTLIRGSVGRNDLTVW